MCPWHFKTLAQAILLRNILVNGVCSQVEARSKLAATSVPHPGRKTARAPAVQVSDNPAFQEARKAFPGPSGANAEEGAASNLPLRQALYAQLQPPRSKKPLQSFPERLAHGVPPSGKAASNHPAVAHAGSRSARRCRQPAAEPVGHSCRRLQAADLFSHPRHFAPWWRWRGASWRGASWRGGSQLSAGGSEKRGEAAAGGFALGRNSEGHPARGTQQSP